MWRAQRVSVCLALVPDPRNVKKGGVKQGRSGRNYRVVNGQTRSYT